MPPNQHRAHDGVLGNVGELNLNRFAWHTRAVPFTLSWLDVV